MSIRSGILSALAALALVLAVPGVAVAGHKGHGHKGCGHHGVPGGNSQVGQYTEPGTLPGSCGNQQVDRSHNPPGNPVSRSTTSRLESFGPAGVAAAQLATATSPPGSGGGAGTKGGSSKGRGGTSASGDGSGGAGAASVAHQVGTALTSGGGSGGGLGILLPLIIAGTAVAGIAYAIFRRRASSA